jgi:hypothetical protein
LNFQDSRRDPYGFQAALIWKQLGRSTQYQYPELYGCWAAGCWGFLVFEEEKTFNQ